MVAMRPVLKVLVIGKVGMVAAPSKHYAGLRGSGWCQLVWCVCAQVK